MLVKEVLRQAALKPDVAVVQLTVSEGNAPAVRLYRSCGFTEFGIEPFAVKSGNRFISKIHMFQAPFAVAAEGTPIHPDQPACGYRS